MKKLLLYAIIFFSNLAIANAGLPIGGYIGLRGGASIYSQNENKDSFKIESTTSPFASINAGLRLLSLRAEVEYLYRHNIQEIKSSNLDKTISSTSIMGNIYYNIFELPFLRLYLNGGLGYTDFNTKLINNDGNFTYNLGFGATFTLAELFSIDAGYRYFDMGKIKIADKKSRFFANDLYVGIRVGF